MINRDIEHINRLRHQIQDWNRTINYAQNRMKAIQLEMEQLHKLKNRRIKSISACTKQINRIINDDI